jgi:hypothetical protein
MRVATESQLDALVQSGALIQQAPASDSLLEKILAGAQASMFLPVKHRRILEDQDLIDR